MIKSLIDLADPVPLQAVKSKPPIWTKLFEVTGNQIAINCQFWPCYTSLPF